MLARLFEPDVPLPDIRNPGMITPDDEQLYFHLAKTFWRPDRSVLEVGTWLGRSTTRICQGLEAAGGDWRLTCFDQYEWQPSHIPKARRGGLPPEVRDLQPGDSFEDAFLQLMSPYRDRIRTVAGDVRRAGSILAGTVPDAAPLAVLFVDASKGWENAALLKALAPHMTTEHEPTRLVFQDFFMYSAFRLHLLLFCLPELEAEYYVGNGGSLSFRLARPLDPGNPILRPNYPKTLSKSGIYEAWERLCDAIPEEHRRKTILQLSLPLMLWHGGFRQEAENEARGLILTDRDRERVGARAGRQAKLDIPPITRLLRGE